MAIDLGKIDVNKTVSSPKSQFAQFLAEGIMAGARPSMQIIVPEIAAEKRSNFLQNVGKALSIGAMSYAEGMGAGTPYSTFMRTQEAQQANQLAATKAQEDLRRWQAEQGLREREVKLKEGGKLMTGEGLPEQDQLSGYKLAVKIAGQRKAADVAPMVYGMMKQGKTMDQIEDELRYSGQSKEFAGPIRDAAQSIFSKAPKDVKDSGMDYIDDLLSRGDTETVREQLKKSARDFAGEEAKKNLEGKERTVEFLDEIAADLDALKKSGIDTNIFRGTQEQILNKVGKISDPRLREIASKMTLSMFSYRRAMSGVAFPEAETKEYQKVFPDITKDYGMNVSLVNTLRSTFGGDVEHFYKNSMGKKAYGALFGKKDASTVGETQQFRVDGKIYNIPADKVEAFKKAKGL